MGGTFIDGVNAEQFPLLAELKKQTVLLEAILEEEKQAHISVQNELRQVKEAVWKLNKQLR